VTIVGEYSDDMGGWGTELVGWMGLVPLAEVMPIAPIMVLGSTRLPEELGVKDVVTEGAEGVVLKDLVFHSNVVDSYAAGLNALNSEVTIDNCAFANLVSWAGSAIWAEGSDVTIARSVFFGNGGSYVNDRSATGESRLGFDVSSLRQDKLPEPRAGVRAQIELPTGYGGAILNWYGTMDISGSVFAFNGAGNAGGAVMSDSSTLGTADCVFAYNSVGSGFDLDMKAGGLTPEDYTSALGAAETWVEPYGGGAVCSILGEYASTGTYYVFNGGDPGAAVNSIMNSASLDRCGFEMNQGAAVTSFGEGLLGPAAASADYGVAALEVEPEPVVVPSGLDIDRCEFYDNDGFFTTYSSSHPTRITNSIYAGNWAVAVVAIDAGGINGNAAQIELPDAPVESSIEGCTFTRNSVDYATVVGPIQDYTTLVNTILWDNDEWEPIFEASNVDAFNVCSEGYLDAGVEEDCFSEEPMFVDFDDWDFRLSEDSPCIDVGTSAPVYAETTAAEAALAWDLRPWDVRNLGRPLDGDDDGVALYDVGAHEYLPGGRVSGLDRYETSVEISKQHFGTSDVVVIATGQVFADGLAGSGLAGLYDAPILLTQPGFLPAVVADEIERLGATKAYILGGSVAVNPPVETALAGLGLEVERIGGVDRYETAAMIAEHLAISGRGVVLAAPESWPVAFIARGDLYADALAVSPVAYANHMPVLLVRPDQLPEHTVDVLLELGITKAIVLGGDVAVSSTVAAQVKALAEDVERIDGADRYETAANIAEWAWDNSMADFGVTGIATGEDFADALSGGAGVGSMNGVLLLNPAAMVHPACEDALQAHADEIEALLVFGGPAALSDSVYDYLMALLAP
jgi:putative cell wall-binding protein